VKMKIALILLSYAALSGEWRISLIATKLYNLPLISDAFCNSDSKNVEVKLKNDILCHYNKEERPKQPKLPIKFNYKVQGFNFVSKITFMR
jgi:hypothetical protein